MEKQTNKFLTWVKSNAINFLIIILSAYFVLNGSIKFIPNDMDWQGKIVYIFTVLLFGLIISSLVAEGGYASGKRDPQYRATRKQAIDLCQEALPHKQEAEYFVSKKIDNDILNERTEILAKASINYCEIFSHDGVPVNIRDKNIRSKYNKKQRKAIRQAIKIKKVPFALFGFTAVKTVGREEAPNETKRKKTKFVSSFIMKALIAMLTGSIMFSFIGLSISSLIYSVFQLCLWYGSGAFGRIGNYNFVVGTMREYDQERIWYLKEFLALPETELKKLQDELKIEKEPEIIALPMIMEENKNAENQRNV